MAYILHIDTSGENSLVALGKDGELIATISNDDARNHASVLNIHIDELLQQAGIKLADISAFCINGGPGSYTGLRIGMATAKGYCYAMDKPLMMHSRLLLLANNHLEAYPDTSYFLAVLQARPGEYFAAIYNRELIIFKEPKHLHQGDLQEFMRGITGKVLCVGFADETLKSTLENFECELIEGQIIDVATWVRYAFEQFNCNEFVNLAHSEPFYLKQVYTHNKKNIS